MTRFQVRFLVFLASLAPHPAVAVDLSITLKGGNRVPVTMFVPQSDRPVPVVLVFGGFREAAKVLALVEPMLSRENPVALASFDYPFEPPRKFVFPGSLRHLPDAKSMVHDTIEGIGVLARELALDPRIDPERVVVLGASLGAPFALAAAAREPAIKGVAVIHGFGDVAGTAAHQLARSWEKRIGILAHPSAWVLGHLAWAYLDAPSPEESAAALRPTQKLISIGASHDRFIPAAASASLADAITRSRAVSEQRVTQGDHLQPGSKKLLRQLFAQVSDWMKRTGLRD